MAPDERIHYYSIGGWTVEVSFTHEYAGNSVALLPSCEPFRVATPREPLLVSLTVDDSLMCPPDEELINVRNFETGNGDTRVMRTRDGGYLFVIKSLDGVSCCLLLAERVFSRCRCRLNGGLVHRQYGLNSALILIYSFSGCHHDTVLLHASVVRQGDYGYAFIAASGTGKSTHVARWLEYIEGSDLMNDDTPVVRVEADGLPYIYGSPWSGKTPCYRPVKAMLGAVTRIDRAKANSIERKVRAEALASVMPACTSMRWDTWFNDGLFATLQKILQTTPVYTLHCLPDEEAARLCHDRVARR